MSQQRHATSRAASCAASAQPLDDATTLPRETDETDETDELDELDELDEIDELFAALNADASRDAASATHVRAVWNTYERDAFDTLYAQRALFARFAAQRIGAERAEDSVAEMWAKLVALWPQIVARARAQLDASAPASAREIALARGLERYAWRVLRNLLIMGYRHREMVARRAPTVSLTLSEDASAHSAHGATATTSVSSSLSDTRDVAAPDGDASNPEQLVIARETLARILAHCATPQHRAIVVLLAQSYDMASVAAMLGYTSRTAPRTAMTRLAARLRVHEPDIDVDGRNPLKR